MISFSCSFPSHQLPPSLSRAPLSLPTNFTASIPHSIQPPQHQRNSRHNHHCIRWLIVKNVKSFCSYLESHLTFLAWHSRLVTSGPSSLLVFSSLTSFPNPQLPPPATPATLCHVLVLPTWISTPCWLFCSDQPPPVPPNPSWLPQLEGNPPSFFYKWHLKFLLLLLNFACVTFPSSL